MTARTKMIAPVAALVALMLGGCAAPSAPDPPATIRPSDAEAVVVEVGDDVFVPDRVEVPVGTTVVWDFDKARRPHNVVFLDDPARVSDILEDGTWSTSFDAPGRYAYRCTLHAGMDGTVIVTSG